MREITVDDGRGVTYQARLATPEQAARFEAAERAAEQARARTQPNTTTERSSASLANYEGPTMPPAAATALRALDSALAAENPACLNDERFVADHLTQAQRTELTNICAGCPLLTPCAAYTAAARPTGGHWPERKKP